MWHCKVLTTLTNSNAELLPPTGTEVSRAREDEEEKERDGAVNNNAARKARGWHSIFQVALFEDRQNTLQRRTNFIDLTKSI